MDSDVQVTRRGAARWDQGHPWIYASDVIGEPGAAGIVAVADPRGKFIGQALYSPGSEIRLRLLDRSHRPIDATWWRNEIGRSAARRSGVDATAFRLVHGEGDGLPSLVVDRYDRWLVAQLLSAGLETARPDILRALQDLFEPGGILLRHDVSVRRQEGLPHMVELASGAVPTEIEVREGAVRFFAAPWTGQKTGAFLDQRGNRFRAAALTRQGGRALDCFSYHGSFAVHLAQHAEAVVAIDESAEALERGAKNAAQNGQSNIEWRRGDAFVLLRAMERAKERFQIVVVDPPAFAKTKGAVTGALRGYKEVNLRAIKLLEPGGILVSASCSYHVKRPEFMATLASAASDAGRRVTVLEHLGQGIDHPELLTVPETGYLKGVVLQVE